MSRMDRLNDWDTSLEANVKPQLEFGFKMNNIV